MKLRYLSLVFLLFMLVPVAYAGISFQPDIMPEIDFSYNPTDYTFELSWRGYYLNVEPYVVYNGKFYTLDKVVPFLENNYGITYRHAVQRFARYDRWGFWLERLPPELSEDLEAVGYRLVDTNIPGSAVELESEPDMNVSRVNFRNGFTLDFSDLEARYDVKLNRTHVHVTGITGLSDIDLDPITYSTPTITITEKSPDGDDWNFWDLWNASNVNGWGVASNNNGSGYQFEFNCLITIGNGTVAGAANLTDVNKQITFIYEPQLDDRFLWVRKDSFLTLGELINETTKHTKNGCSVKWENTYNSRYYPIDGNKKGTVCLYGCELECYDETDPTYDGNPYIHTVASGSRTWNSIFNGLAPEYYSGAVDHFNVIVEYSNGYGYLNPDANSVFDDITLYDCNLAAVYTSISNSTFRNFKIYDSGRTVHLTDATPAQEAHLIDFTVDQWIIDLNNESSNAYREYSVNLLVKDELGSMVNNSLVQLYDSDTNLVMNLTTNINGVIPEKIVKRGTYTGSTTYPVPFTDYGPFRLHVEKTGYLPTDIFNITLEEPINWEITLIPEEYNVAITNAVNLELLIFSTISILFSTLALLGNELKGMIGSVGGFFCWAATGLWFLWNNASTNLAAFYYLFWMLALGCLILFIRHMLNYSFRTPKKAKWDKYE